MMIRLNGLRRRLSWVNVLLWCVFGILLAAGFRENNIIRRFSGISLRYETPISGQTALRARQYAITNGETFWPTFWQDGSAAFSIGRGDVYSDIISFSGNADLIWPARYIAGSAPGSLDSYGVAMSEALAHRIWGSIDIIGQSVEINGETRTVRGVFRGDAALALLPFSIDDTSQSWSGVVLSGGVTHATQAEVENFALSSGLGRPSYILMGGEVALAGIMVVFPLFVPGIYALLLMAKFIRMHYPGFGVPLIIAGLMLFAVLLPYLLSRLPDWIIPTHWSDFSFWSSLFQQAGNSMQEFLSVNPGLRDVALRIHLMRLIGFLFLSISCGLSVCFRWRLGQHAHIHQHNGEKYTQCNT